MLMMDAPLTSGQPSLEDLRLDGYLDAWARYASAPSGELGYPRGSVGFASGGGGWDSSEEALSGGDLERCKAIDTIVHEELVPSQSAAIRHRYELAVFRFPRGNYPELLLAARLEIIKRLRRRHQWIV